jgi:hypothetical protein
MNFQCFILEMVDNLTMGTRHHPLNQTLPTRELLKSIHHQQQQQHLQLLQQQQQQQQDQNVGTMHSQLNVVGGGGGTGSHKNTNQNMTGINTGNLGNMKQMQMKSQMRTSSGNFKNIANLGVGELSQPLSGYNSAYGSTHSANSAHSMLDIHSHPHSHPQTHTQNQNQNININNINNMNMNMNSINNMNQDALTFYHTYNPNHNLNRTLSPKSLSTKVRHTSHRSYDFNYQYPNFPLM